MCVCACGANDAEFLTHAKPHHPHVCMGVSVRACMCVCMFQTHMAEELVGEPQVVVQGEHCHSLKTNHDYLGTGHRK